MAVIITETLVDSLDIEKLICRTPIEQAIKNLEALADKYKGRQIRIITPSWNDTSYFLELVELRPETPKECTLRVAMENAKKLDQEAQERKLLASLQAKYAAKV